MLKRNKRKKLRSKFAAAVLSASALTASFSEANVLSRLLIEDYLIENCIQTNSDITKIRKNKGHLSTALINLGETKSLLGQAFYKKSYELDTYFCQDDRKVPIGAQASYKILENVAVFKEEMSAREIEFSSIHEIMHVIQANTLKKFNYSKLDIIQRINLNLAKETAAHFARIIYAFELKELDGNSLYWDSIMEEDGQKDLLLSFEDIYRETIGSEEGVEDHSSALIFAIEETWNDLLLDNERWRDYYLTQGFKNYLLYLERGLLDSLPESGDEWIVKLREMGKVSDEFNFTKNIKPFPLKGLLDENPKIGWAFEAIEFERLARIVGRETIKDKLEDARNEGNPYLDIDMGQLRQQFLTIKEFKFFTEVMDEMVGSKGQEQLLSLKSQKVQGLSKP